MKEAADNPEKCDAIQYNNLSGFICYSNYGIYFWTLSLESHIATFSGDSLATYKSVLGALIFHSAFQLVQDTW